MFVYLYVIVKLRRISLAKGLKTIFFEMQMFEAQHQWWVEPSEKEKIQKNLKPMIRILKSQSLLEFVNIELQSKTIVKIKFWRTYLRDQHTSEMYHFFHFITHSLYWNSFCIITKLRWIISWVISFSKEVHVLPWTFISPIISLSNS